MLQYVAGSKLPIIRIPIKGGMTIPNIATFDHGTYVAAANRTCFLFPPTAAIFFFWVPPNRAGRSRLGQSGPLLLEFVETFLEPLSQRAMTIQESKC